MNRHRDSPCIFRQAAYLYTQLQRDCIDRLFPAGWANDPGCPILSCIGKLRIATPSDTPPDSDNGSDMSDDDAESPKTIITEVSADYQHDALVVKRCIDIIAY